ncbi:uncharacterized protein EDB91DRAFT_1084210 [Suillus paluster]|uniref:uncharacterized protein n=1 Tax=Suillus paluster TaxID=48578 RepID=UPI001B886110|nr:uncharacterized protein EDB91DRAFT_1084210 [Suillus paluster]KAG1734066.1 hypothetical protein EDB91DRAFT_1084210 [Suillus paluster]
MSSEEDVVSALRWNNNMAVVILTLVSYDYILQFEKEVKYVWVRYFGLFLAMVCGCCYGLVVLVEWGLSVYFFVAEVILIWRLYALYNQSKLILRPAAFSVVEITYPHANYCTSSFNIGPMPAIYASIPIICYDIFLVVLAAVILVKHMKERREVRMRPNTYVVMIVRCHIIYFVLNLTNQILSALLWINLPEPAMSLSETFINTAPFIIAPRLIISIWDMHANEECSNIISTAAFADCMFDEHEMDSCTRLPEP